VPDPPGNAHRSLKDTSSRKSRRKMGKKGQPEGSAVKSRTGKPRVAGTDRKTWNAAERGAEWAGPSKASL
jgi:hypothetical protein